MDNSLGSNSLVNRLFNLTPVKRSEPSIAAQSLALQDKIAPQDRPLFIKLSKLENIPPELFERFAELSVKDNSPTVKKKFIKALQDTSERFSKAGKQTGQVFSKAGQVITKWGQETGTAVKNFGNRIGEETKKVKAAASHQAQLGTAKMSRAMTPQMLKANGYLATRLNINPFALAPKSIRNNEQVLTAAQPYLEACKDSAEASKANVIASSKVLGIKFAKGAGVSVALMAALGGLGGLIAAIANKRAAEASAASGASEDAPLPDCDPENVENFDEIRESNPELADKLESIVNQIGDEDHPGSDSSAKEIREQAVKDIKESLNNVPAEYRTEFLESFSASASLELMNYGGDLDNYEGSAVTEFLHPELVEETIQNSLKKAGNVIESSEMSQVPAEDRGREAAIASGISTGVIFGAVLGGGFTIASGIKAKRKINQGPEELPAGKKANFEDKLLQEARSAHQTFIEKKTKANDLYDKEVRPVVEQVLDARVAQVQARATQNPHGVTLSQDPKFFDLD